MYCIFESSTKKLYTYTVRGLTASVGTARRVMQRAVLSIGAGVALTTNSASGGDKIFVVACCARTRAQ